MTFDFGEVLTRAWQITWEHKVLWLFGLLISMISSLFILIGLAPVASIFMSEGFPVWLDNPIYIFGFFGIILLLMVLSFVVGTITQAAIAVGVLRASQNDEKMAFGEIFRASITFFWRFLGIIGLLISGYIFNKKRKGGHLVCVIGKNCDVVLSSKYNKLFGFPNELLGILYYLSVVILSLLFIYGTSTLVGFSLINIIIGITFIGVLFSLYFLYIQFFV